MFVHPLSSGPSFPLELIVPYTGNRTCNQADICFHFASPYCCYARQVTRSPCGYATSNNNLCYIDIAVDGMPLDMASLLHVHMSNRLGLDASL
jgi:hypothetical protein